MHKVSPQYEQYQRIQAGSSTALVIIDMHKLFAKLMFYLCHQVKSLSHIWLFATPSIIAHQTSLSMGFSRQEYWSVLPFPSPGDLPDPGIKLTSLALANRFFTTEPPGKPFDKVYFPTKHVALEDTHSAPDRNKDSSLAIYCKPYYPCWSVGRYRSSANHLQILNSSNRCVLSRFSYVWLCVILWTVDCQAPLSMGSSRQEYWSEFPFPSPGDISDTGIKLVCLISNLAGGFFTTRAPWQFIPNWVLATQSCLTLCDPMDYSLLVSSVHGISQARILEWVAILFSRLYS